MTEMARFRAGALRVEAAVAAIAQGEDALKATIGDQAVADAATQRLKNILVKIGYREAPPPAMEPDPVKVFFANLLEQLLKAASDYVYDTVGARGYSDRF